jgi:hypothetical protein
MWRIRRRTKKNEDKVFKKLMKVNNEERRTEKKMLIKEIVEEN